MNSSLRASTLALVFLRGVSLVLTLAVSVLLARVLGPEPFGHYVFVTATLALLAIPAFCGWPNLIVRNTARFHLDQDWGRIRGLLRTASGWVLSVALGLAILFLALRRSVPADPEAGLFLLGLPLLLLIGLTNVTSATLRGLHLPLRAQTPALLVQPLMQALLLAALVLAAGLTPGTAVVSMVASWAIALLCARAFWLGAARPHPAPVRLEPGKWLRELPPFAALSFATLVSAQLAVVLLGWLSDPASAALFRVADRAALFVAMPLQVVNLVFAPLFVRAHREGDSARLQIISDTMVRWSLLGALPGALLLFIFAEPVLRWVYGADYVAATPALRLLVLGQSVNVAMGSVALLLNMTGLERRTLAGFVTGLLVNGVLCLLLIPSHGLVGAAIATAAGVVSWNLLLALQVRRLLNVRIGPLRAVLSSRWPMS